MTDGDEQGCTHFPQLMFIFGKYKPTDKQLADVSKMRQKFGVNDFSVKLDGV